MIALWICCQSASDCSSRTSTKRSSSTCGSLHRVTDTPAETPTELVHLDVTDGDDAVATITLDSPHNRNALSRQLVTELFERLGAAEADDAVKVVLVRSSGRVF